MNTQDRIREQELAKERKKLNEQTKILEIQNRFNERNIKRQHKFNLEIFGKQAELTCKIHKKQSRLTIISICCATLAAILGMVIGVYLPTKESSTQEKPQVEQSITNEKTSQPHIYLPTSLHRKKEAESSEHMASSLVNDSSNSQSYNQSNAADAKGCTAD